MKHRWIIIILAVSLIFLACNLEKTELPPQTVLYVRNFSSQDIYAVYCSDASSDSWGDDLLGKEILPASGERKFTVTPGLKDIRVDTQATYGSANGAYEEFGVQFDEGKTVEIPLYDN